MESMTKKQRRQIEEAIGIAIDSVLPDQSQTLIEEIAEFAVTRLKNPAPGFVNPYAKETFNLTHQLKVESENPEAAAMLEKQALTQNRG